MFMTTKETEYVAIYQIIKSGVHKLIIHLREGLARNQFIYQLNLDNKTEVKCVIADDLGFG